MQLIILPQYAIWNKNYISMKYWYFKRREMKQWKWKIYYLLYKKINYRRWFKKWAQEPYGNAGIDLVAEAELAGIKIAGPGPATSAVLPDPAWPAIQVIGLFLLLSSSLNNHYPGKMFESLSWDILVAEDLFLLG